MFFVRISKTATVDTQKIAAVAKEGKELVVYTEGGTRLVVDPKNADALFEAIDEAPL